MRNMIKFGLLLTLLGGGIYLFTWGPWQPYTSPRTLLTLLDTVRGRWWLAPLFIAAYAVSGLVAFPGTVATLVGGALFGVVKGSLCNWIGGTLNACCGFLVARALGRTTAAKLAGGRLAPFDAALEHHGLRAILLMRLVPLFPFNGVNLGAGLSRMRLRDYLLGTAIGILPGCVIYTYFAVALIAGSLEARRSSYWHLAIASLLLVLLTFLPKVLGRRRVTKHPATNAPTG